MCVVQRCTQPYLGNLGDAVPESILLRDAERRRRVSVEGDSADDRDGGRWGGRSGSGSRGSGCYRIGVRIGCAKSNFRDVRIAHAGDGVRVADDAVLLLGPGAEVVADLGEMRGAELCARDARVVGLAVLVRRDHVAELALEQARVALRRVAVEYVDVCAVFAHGGGSSLTFLKYPLLLVVAELVVQVEFESKL
jgi:hypothetical protein